MRIFVAIDLSDKAKKEIKKLYKVLKRKHWPAKWEKADKLHLTLAFLDRQEKEKLKIIKSACQRSIKEINPFEISFKCLGCFPDYDQPRVIWLGLKGDLKSLAKLQKQLFNELKLKNFPLEARPFSPHITLARIKKARFKEKREIGRQLKKFKVQSSKFKIFSDCKVLVDKMVIYESKLSRQGSTYHKLAEISFTEDEN